jgi:hypothetical protein
VLPPDNLRANRDRRGPDRRNLERRRDSRRDEDPDQTREPATARFPRWVLVLALSGLGLLLATFLLVAWFVVRHG